MIPQKFLLQAVACICVGAVSLTGSKQALSRQDSLSRSEAMLAAAKEIAVSDGLRIRQIADDALVPDCTCVAVDVDHGRVVASGPGYVRELLDTNSDGVFEETRTIVAAPAHGAHGLCFDRGALYYVGDNGVWKVGAPFDADDAAKKAVRVLSIKTGGEHDAHALRRGSDGSWYLIAGNGTKGMFDLQNAANPSIPHPRAGVIWKISSDWSTREVWAHGFRNAYDFDFAPDEAIDTFDSDGERDVSLPWYRPTRVFRVRQGDDAGWISRSWKRPNTDPQMPHVLAELGRGSPTGVHRGRNQCLPSRFDRGVFVCDWTFGRVIFVGDDGNTELVASPKGTAGFAVTDIDSLPSGELIVSVGGRRSRGGIFMIEAVSPRVDGQTDRTQDAQNPNAGAAVEMVSVTRTIRDRICQLRNRDDLKIDSKSASLATQVLTNAGSTESEHLAAVALLIESVGGLGPGDPKDARGKQQVAAVFDGYRSRLRPKLDDATRTLAVDAMVGHLKNETTGDDFRHELIRGIAVLEPESESVFITIADDLDRVNSPVEKLHRLIALARLPVRRSDEMTERMAEVMLDFPVQIREAGLKTDRNWTPRLGELFLAIEHRDSLLPSRLVASPKFGHASHLVWTDRMDPENLERARRKCLMQSRTSEIDPAVARFIALGPDAVPRSFIYRWLERPATRPAAWLAIASHARDADASELKKAALSVDQPVRDAAVKALQRLGHKVPQPESNSEAVQRWLAQTDRLQQLDGDPERGRILYIERQCGVCHTGGNALGPSLDGVGKRFGTADLFRATVDPNHNVPDRFRPKQVLTQDGDIVIGMVVYESVDGLTLQTQNGKTHRINADDIVEARTSRISIMPEGLLLGLSLAEAADLMAYLRSL